MWKRVYSMSTTGQKSRINHIFNVLKQILLCLPRLMEKISNIVKSLLQFQITVFHLSMLSNVIYFCDQSCIFSIITPVFSVTWSSEIIKICWFAAQLSVINNGSFYYSCFLQLNNYDLFLWWIKGNIINIFVTFDQLNASLLNKSIIYLFNHTYPKLWNGISWCQQKY